jgi:hypothetical protein
MLCWCVAAVAGCGLHASKNSSKAGAEEVQLHYQMGINYLGEEDPQAIKACLLLKPWPLPMPI